MGEILPVVDGPGIALGKTDRTWPLVSRCRDKEVLLEGNESIDDALRGWLGTVQLTPAVGDGSAAPPVERGEQVHLALFAATSTLRRGKLEETLQLLEWAAQTATDDSTRSDICAQYLRLARAWGKRGSAPGSSDQVERVLRAAVALDSALATAALARELHRQNRRDEAIEQWQAAIRLNPEAASYVSLARLYEQTAQPQRALAAYLDSIHINPVATQYLTVAQKLDDLTPMLPELQSGRRLKIALLGNATLDYLQSYVKVECYDAGLRPVVYQCGFDQYTQEILGPDSGLYAFNPDVVVCAIHASRLFPRLHQFPFELTVDERRHDMETGLDTVQALLDALRKRSSALVLLHNMVLPQHLALGILDQRDELGQTALFAQINARLATLVRERYADIYLVDEERIQAQRGKARATDARLWLTARMGWTDEVLLGLAREYLRFIKPSRALSRKCIILDLDNTLWGGIVGEDGMTGIQLGAEAPGNAFVAFQRELERLWRRGILLALCSKNNEQDALAVFEQHPGMVLTLSHFAARRINWDSKVGSIRSIATELNLGLDACVFFDDNPNERAQVQAALPQVLVPDLPADPAHYRNALLQLNDFESLALTAEDRQRNQIYVEQRARREHETKATEDGSLEAYLSTLETVVQIEQATEMTVPRIAQLTNKTNQFNLTTRRRTEANVIDLQSQGAHIFTMGVSDRFGDNGLVGVAIVAASAATIWELDTLLLSCRVIGRGVETALLAYVCEQARHSGSKQLRGWYFPTAKNQPARDCYRRHNFRLIEDRPDGAELWELDLQTATINNPPWIAVRLPASVS